MNVTPFTESELMARFEEFEYYDIKVRKDYSGRGMYGASCFGIVHDLPDAVLGGIIVGLFEDKFEAINMLESARIDNMGRSTITYFPGWGLKEEG